MSAAFDTASEERHGRLVVLEMLPGSRTRVRCDCGNEKVVRVHHLRGGRVRSCGCLQRELASARMRTHGAKPVAGASPEYRVWQNVLTRCLNPARKGTERYRDLGVCAGWAGSFASFLADMGPRPDGTSIDRRDNARGYTCGHCEECVRLGRTANCRWATPIEQSRNRGNNHLLTVDGESLPIAAWSERTGTPARTIWQRVRLGWSDERAVRAPVDPVKSAARKGSLARVHAANDGACVVECDLCAADYDPRDVRP